MFRGAKKRTFRFGKKNVSFPKVETFRFADYSFLITHLGFVPFSEEKIEDYFLLYGGFDTKEEREGYLKDVISKNRINQKKKLKREFKTCGLRAFYNLYQRKKWIYFLKKNNMF